MNKLYLNSARIIHEETQLEQIKRNVRYLNAFATGPSVAEHVGTATKIAWVLARLAKEKDKKVDPAKVVELVLWHDTEETRTWDLGRDIRRYVEINEEKALDEKFSTVEWGKEVRELKKAFEKKGDRDVNVRLARDADVLYVVLTIRKMVKSGVAIHDPDQRIAKTSARLETDEGKMFASALAEIDPSEWWDVMMGYKFVSSDGLTKEETPSNPLSAARVT